jgi:hypothetical protein
MLYDLGGDPIRPTSSNEDSVDHNIQSLKTCRYMVLGSPALATAAVTVRWLLSHRYSYCLARELLVNFESHTNWLWSGTMSISHIVSHCLLTSLRWAKKSWALHSRYSKTVIFYITYRLWTPVINRWASIAFLRRNLRLLIRLLLELLQKLDKRSLRLITRASIETLNEKCEW